MNIVMKILTSLFKNHQVVNSKLSKAVITKLKENILIYGPTGTGKTEILKRIADIYGVPIVFRMIKNYVFSQRIMMSTKRFVILLIKYLVKEKKIKHRGHLN